ncbi:hypothetical protein PY650_27655, partial [Rhizobium calliandrae]
RNKRNHQKAPKQSSLKNPYHIKPPHLFSNAIPLAKAYSHVQQKRRRKAGGIRKLSAPCGVIRI